MMHFSLSLSLCVEMNKFHSISAHPDRTLLLLHHRRTGHTRRKRKRRNFLGHLDYYSEGVPEEVDYKDNFEEEHRVQGA